MDNETLPRERPNRWGASSRHGRCWREAIQVLPPLPAGRPPLQPHPAIKWIAGNAYEHYFEHQAWIGALVEPSWQSAL